MSGFKFSCGDELKDRVTGFSGIAMCRTEWITNCNTYGLQPRTLTKEGNLAGRQHFDEPNLELVKASVIEQQPERVPGGPTPDIPATNR